MRNWGTWSCLGVPLFSTLPVAIGVSVATLYPTVRLCCGSDYHVYAARNEPKLDLSQSVELNRISFARALLLGPQVVVQAKMNE